VAELKQFIAGKEGLWLVKYMPPDYDPGNAVEGWLARHAYRLSQVWVENITFTHYSLPTVSVEPGSTAYHALNASFDERISLVGYALDRSSAAPGETLHLALYWQAQREIGEDYTVFVHLLGPDDRKVAQTDSQPAGDTHPTHDWTPGEKVVDLRALPVAADAPPGEYRLVVGLYRPASGDRLRLLREGRPPSTQLQLTTITLR
ncbi:MAG: hypothetical protein M1380_02155, partial [Chloroflexi bacterium]|nr:hypothetical protein [Chloroflexota bacterium]